MTCKHLMRDAADCVFCERDRLKQRVEELTLGLQGLGKHPEECAEEGGACVSHLAFEELIIERDSLRQELKESHDTLRGISTCSTCEVCRGAALSRLGGSVPQPDKKT